MTEPRADTPNRRRRLGVVLGITAATSLVELGAGLATNSLALIADASHMLTDAGAIALALGAAWLAARPPSAQRTFGWRRVEIVAAAINAVALFAVSLFLLWRAWTRLGEAPEIATGPMIAVAALGLVANGVALAILRGTQGETMNLRAAYFEVLADTLASVGVIVAGVVIAATGRVEADAVASALIGLFIIPRTWSLLRQALDVLIDASPRGVDMAEVRRHILETPGVLDLHDLHVWTIASGLHAVSAHVVVAEHADRGAVLDGLSRCLDEDFDVEHATFQLETLDRSALESAGHA